MHVLLSSYPSVAHAWCFLSWGVRISGTRGLFFITGIAGNDLSQTPRSGLVPHDRCNEPLKPGLSCYHLTGSPPMH